MANDTIDKFDGYHRFLSNFAPSVIVVPDDVLGREVVVATVEHGYQADKTVIVSERTDIIAAPTPGVAKKLGQTVTLRPGWDTVKVDRMAFWLRHKFAIPALRDKLLATEDAPLVEGNHWGDTFWGVCGGVGENHLGRLLMQVRDEIRRAE